MLASMFVGWWAAGRNSYSCGWWGCDGPSVRQEVGLRCDWGVKLARVPRNEAGMSPKHLRTSQPTQNNLQR